MTDRQKLTDEISRLEKELDSQHFRGLFDQRAQHKKENRLKKLRRELAELEGTSVVQQPFRKPEVAEAPRPARQPKDVKVPVPAPKAAAPARATKSPAKPAPKPAAKPVARTKAPAAKKKSPSKPAAKPAPRKKSR